MNLYKLKGSGLPNVFLDGGVVESGEGDERRVAYSNLDGLYMAIACAIGMRTTAMTPAELKFLRKRLEMSQSDIAKLGDKTDQVVAKWEKGRLPVPKAEADLVRLATLATFGTAKNVALRVKQLTSDSTTSESPYVFSFRDGKWSANEGLAREYALEQSRLVAIESMKAAMRSSSVTVVYSGASISPVAVSKSDQKEQPQWSM